jgi:hypothetical protein
MSGTYRILYNDTPLDINPQAFADASRVFAQYYQPDNPGEMGITSEMPLEFFREFLPAVQGQRIALTERNIDAMRTLARDWEVAALAEQCDRWENSPEVILHRLREASHDKDAPRCEELIQVVAGRIDEFLRLEQLMLIPPKYLQSIITHANCHATDQRELFKVIMSLVEIRQAGCSALLNSLSIDALSDDDLGLVIMSDNLDRGAAGPFMAQVALRFLRGSQTASADIGRLEAASRHAEQQRAQRLNELRGLEQRLAEEKIQHGECVRQLNAMYERYEPTHPRAVANRPPPPPKAEPRPPPAAPQAQAPTIVTGPMPPKMAFLVRPPAPPPVQIKIEKPKAGKLTIEGVKIALRRP